MKPRLTRHGWYWACVGQDVGAIGLTPEMAYAIWLMHKEKRT